MRYVLSVLTILLLSLAPACSEGESDGVAPAAQATIDAAVARLSATLAANATPTPTSASVLPTSNADAGSDRAAADPRAIADRGIPYRYRRCRFARPRL